MELSCKPNFSRLFIYPMLRLPHSFDKFIYNTYIYHEDFKELADPHIFVIMKFNPGEAVGINFEDLERIVQDHIDYFTQYDIDKGSYVCFVFKIPDIHIDDYIMFTKGLYSKFSPDYQEYLGNNNPKNFYYKVFNRVEELRLIVEAKIGEKLDDNDEVIDIMNEVEETFVKTKLK